MLGTLVSTGLLSGQNWPSVFLAPSVVIWFDFQHLLLANYVIFVANNCNFGIGSSLPKCQEFCLLYEGYCHFFLFDATSETCELFNYPANDYEITCNKVGGSTSPDISTCSNQDVIIEDPCIVSRL